MSKVLDKLLETLDVRLHAFAVCQIPAGRRLVFDPMEAVIIHYVLAGNGVLRASDDRSLQFRPGNIMIVPPRLPQSLGAAGNGLQDIPASEVAAMLADGLIKFTAGPGTGEIITICGTISATYSGAFGLFDHLPGPLVFDIAEVGPLVGVFDHLLAELRAPGIGTRALTEALMKQCLVLLLRRHLVEHGSESPLFALLKDPRLAKAIAFVLNNPGNSNSLTELAEIAGMSRSSFAEHFGRVFDETPLEFVQRVRLHHAAHLLSTTDLPIKLVSSSVGYASRSHFSRSFRDAYDVDPKTYRSLKAVTDEPAPPAALYPVKGSLL